MKNYLLHLNIMKFECSKKLYQVENQQNFTGRTVQSGQEFCRACLLLLETSRNCRDSQPDRGDHFSHFC